MNALLLTVALAAGQTPPPATTPGTGRDHAMLTGAWTVLAFEKNGQLVQDAQNATVTFHANNTITWDGQNKDKMKAMRIEFGPMNTVRVTELDAAGVGRPGTGTADRGTAGAGTGTNPPDGAGTGNQPGAAGRAGASASDSRHGVFVKAGDYFAISLQDDNARGGAGTGTRTGTADRGTAGAGGTGNQPGFDRGAAGDHLAKTYCSIVLRKAGAGSGAGTDRR